MVETDKAQVEMPSPFGGRVDRVHVRSGQRVKVGAVLLSFADAGGAARPAVGARGCPRRPAGARRPQRAAATAPPAPAAAPGLPPAAAPSTRRLARELGVDLGRSAGPARAAGSPTTTSRGRRGRPAAAARRGARRDAGGRARPGGAAAPLAAPTPARRWTARPLAGPVALPPLPRFEQWGPVEREPLRGIRRRSAEHMALAGP